ncbi:MAG: aminotransferase class V-fold PLP-dependent enzyme [Cyclobacteriaceae bacterium]
MKCQRAKFMLPRKIAYLNCAYMSPMMKKVEKAGIKGIQMKRKPYQVGPDDFFHATETLRAMYAEMINAPDSNRIVVIPSVSYGMANVANNVKLKKGDKIIVIGEQFPSNVYPWMVACKAAGATLQIIEPPTGNESRGEQWNADILAAIDGSTKLIALGHVHWADGTKFDLKAIRAKTREVRALMVIDGTQSVGALPFDIQEFEPDALVCAGYKWLMGPYSIGLAYYGPAFDDGAPVEDNWINRFESENFANLVNYQESYQPGALRYEVGEHSNFVLLPMMLQAVKQIRRWGVDNIQGYCKNLSAPFLEEIKSLGYHMEQEEYRSAHLFGIRLGAEHSLEKLQKSLKANKVSVSVRGSAIRIAPNVYNDALDFKRLIRALDI